MEELGIRPGLYSGIHVTQAVKENHDLSLRVRIDETQENPIVFEKVDISNCESKENYMRRSTGDTLYPSL